MDIFQRETYDTKTVVKIIIGVDLVQSLLVVFVRACAIIFRPMLSEEDSLVYRQNQSSTFVVILFVVTMSFYALHITMALKLASSLQVMETNSLTAARSAKFWQNWAILVLVFLIANLFSSVLSASTKVGVFFATLFGLIEICWRLFGIYNVGLFIDQLIEDVPNLIPTVQFFGVRFPAPVYSRSLESILPP